ncbi:MULTISPECIES: HIT family protein [Brevibacterium]|uniref:Histidine triad (HIT) protein n=3 Tax=Brevibacterium casei TaxID=33889 RepID=K9AKR3_9MICO|nr:histidine triad (HIT) protein [Brevibacterium casei S18]MBE4693987.1 HIT domain-containing protein [Brevibacterium casei]MBY3577110.1 HIT domain-containing protein [Brevibacterium casei]SII84408.1 HIT family hydrolase, diadenosine tetraphosphate hydrolase [Mycobacteroides abscessus subsp. abscessus]VEW12331.1 AP-4-A phosphorylase [Brevibacterium casei]
MTTEDGQSDHLGEGKRTEPDLGMDLADIESASGFPGEPDGFQRLWTPHRMVYIGGQDKPKDSGVDECPFCAAPKKSDEEGLIVARGESVYAVLNLYPYNPGHLLICPYRHVADYTELTEEETVELAHFTQKAMRVIRSVSGPDGFNLGMNQGEVAGAGIAAHLHQHVVPRWSGDANFLPVVAQTKALPQVHADARAALSREWNR